MNCSKSGTSLGQTGGGRSSTTNGTSLYHHIRGDPELALACQDKTVLFLYLGAA
jgi:hypothetical protein